MSEPDALAVLVSTSGSIPVPETALRSAHARRQRVTWPDTFEACMRDSLYARLILIEALHGAANATAGATGVLNSAPIQHRVTNGIRYWWQDSE